MENQRQPLSDFQVDVHFDAVNGFEFKGLVSSVVGPRLYVPYSENDTPIIFKKVDDNSWCFRTISFWGTSSFAPQFLNVWRTVTAAETPSEPIGNPEVFAVIVHSIDDDEIFLTTSVKPLPLNVGVNFQLTIEDAQGRHWTSADPQIINEKKPG